MYKVKVLKTKEDRFGYFESLDETTIKVWGITEWDEIKDQAEFAKLQNAVHNANKLKRTKKRPHYYLLVYYYDDSESMFDELYKSSEEFIKYVEKQTTVEEKRAEAARKKREENAKKKKRQQLEKLKKELGEE